MSINPVWARCRIWTAKKGPGVQFSCLFSNLSPSILGWTVYYLTLAMIDEKYSAPGTEVSFIWGEENGGSSKPNIERHSQTKIRAIVSPVPYAEVARKEYADNSWRAAQ